MFLNLNLKKKQKKFN